jgi:hypothetical protein
MDTKKHKQELWSASLLVDTFGASVRDLRHECNRLASLSIARTLVLLAGLVAALLVRYWIV